MAENEYPLDALVKVVKRLRGRNGCPWDQAQDHDSLRPNLIEEAYEVLDAIDVRDPELLCEELGDLLLQIVFHSQLASEKEQFTINDVVQVIVDKMIRRHPHVFGTVEVEGVEDVLENWEDIKKRERLESRKDEEENEDFFAGILDHLPALMLAERIQRKAARVGFDWEEVEGALSKVEEELDEFKASYRLHRQEEANEELGDLLFAVVNVARFAGVEPELALRGTVQKFRERFTYIADHLRENSLKWEEMTLKELDELWEESKEYPG